MAEQRPIDWLLIGTGDIARKRVLPALRQAPGCRVVAVCGRTDAAARAFADEFGIDRSFDCVETALSDSYARATYIATPVDLHVPLTIAALKAGLDVLVEKPLGLDAGECAAAVACARAHPAVAGCAYYRRCSARYQHARETIARGELGRIVFVRMAYSSWFDPVPDGPGHWRVVKARSAGGPLADVGSHMFDLLIGLFGLPRTVFARAESTVHRYAVEDSAVVVMELACGAQAVASFHWNSRAWAHSSRSSVPTAASSGVPSTRDRW